MLVSIKARREEVARLVAATFPEYKGRKFTVVEAKTVGLYDLNWDGGTRNVYRACTTAGERLGDGGKLNKPAPWLNKADGQSLEIPQGACVVRHSVFQSTDSGITIFMHPEDMPKWIEARAG